MLKEAFEKFRPTMRAMLWWGGRFLMFEIGVVAGLLALLAFHIGNVIGTQLALTVNTLVSISVIGWNLGITLIMMIPFVYMFYLLLVIRQDDGN